MEPHTRRRVARRPGSASRPGAGTSESAEFLEHFIWANDHQMPHVTEERRAAIMAEVADIAILLTYLSHDLSIDLEAVVSEKMAANEQKYQLARSYGSNKKYMNASVSPGKQELGPLDPPSLRCATTSCRQAGRPRLDPFRGLIKVKRSGCAKGRE